MRIGLDFDNTIVCYDKAIALLAEELFDLPEDVARTKLGLRDHLREAGRESEWTTFQGQLYGPGMRYAEPFEGAVTTMEKLREAGHELIIVSHRSRWPYAGPRYDLHKAARLWIQDRLQKSGLFTDEKAYFLETKEKKLEMIANLDCQVFLDDLPEVISSSQFPTSTLGFLFKPDIKEDIISSNSIINKWQDLIDTVNQLV